MPTLSETLTSGPERLACFAVMKGIARIDRTRQDSGNAARLLRSICKSSVGTPRILSWATCARNCETLILLDSLVVRLNRPSPSLTLIISGRDLMARLSIVDSGVIVSIHPLSALHVDGPT